MHVSEKGVAFIATHEGVVTRAYRDVAGVWTIGVGHTAAAGPPIPKAGMTITREEALALLARDLPRYERRVEAALPGVPQAVFDGAVSFDFNTGAIHRASWVAAYRDGRPGVARAGLMQWTKAGGRTIAGLVRRREAEARLIFDGTYGEHAAAGAAQASAEVAACQRQLARLGFYKGAVDGIAGPATRAAVVAYQRTHPDLVADGIVGPATRASLERDIAARVATAEAGAIAAGTATVASAGAAWSGADPLFWAAAVGAAALILATGFFAWRYRGELRRLLFNRKGK